MRIAVASIPGVGKTDLARALSKRLNLPLVTVPVEEIFRGEGDLWFNLILAEEIPHGTLARCPI